MIVYQKTKEDFSNDILTDEIDKIVAAEISSRTGRQTARSELRAFKNSLEYMHRVISDKEIPDDCGVSIEYHIPQTSKRIDFIITGSDGKSDNAIIVELKQWTSASLTDYDGLVETTFAHGNKIVSHPSYQAWSYAALLKSFNAAVEESKIGLQACAYLHNYAQDDVITHALYQPYIEKAPVFLKPDGLKLRQFIKQFIRHGDKSKIIVRINNGKIRPTKGLADSLASLIKGNQEFVMVDDQKVVFEVALKLAEKSSSRNKNVLICGGWTRHRKIGCSH